MTFITKGLIQIHRAEAMIAVYSNQSNGRFNVKFTMHYEKIREQRSEVDLGDVNKGYTSFVHTARNSSKSI